VVLIVNMAGSLRVVPPEFVTKTVYMPAESVVVGTVKVGLVAPGIGEAFFRHSYVKGARPVASTVKVTVLAVLLEPPVTV
jgi:hypothetical protein